MYTREKLVMCAFNIYFIRALFANSVYMNDIRVYMAICANC